MLGSVSAPDDPLNDQVPGTESGCLCVQNVVPVLALPAIVAQIRDSDREGSN